MARTARTPRQITSAATVLASHTWVGTTDGDSFAHVKPTFLMIKNNGAGSHTITIPTGATFEGFAVADHTFTIAAGATAIILISGTAFHQAGSNDVYINYDATPGELVTNLFTY